MTTEGTTPTRLAKAAPASFASLAILLAAISVGQCAAPNPLLTDERIHPVAALAGQGATGAEASGVVPLSQLGARVQGPYSGDGISVTPTLDGARLKAVFQKLEGLATDQGLWLLSTEPRPSGGVERFRVIASGVGRLGGELRSLPRQGKVLTQDQVTRFLRPGLTEEYRVSMDGVRQDFIVHERPSGKGPLQLVLTVDGATAERMTYGARLILNESGRAIAYSRLKVSDCTGRTLAARLDVLSQETLAVVVDDPAAVYPIRIDPTFSDADWVSMSGFPGANDGVDALVVDGSGNLYAGGNFTAIGNVAANHVAKWDGSTWSPLGSGTDDSVSALAISGNNLYVGGFFTNAGGILANNVAQWNGTNWSALGSGMNSGVNALLVSGTNLYAGGWFSTADGNPASRIAQWNGSAWSPLGAGLSNDQYDNFVRALIMFDGDLYVGGSFKMAGAVAALSIARWNGTDWSGLDAGLGISNSEPQVQGLAVIGTNLYAGGDFTTASGIPASNIAKWNGSTWSALGSGVDNNVYTLASSGSALYVGGFFTHAGGNGADYLATWNGSVWAPVGTGMESSVTTIAISGSSVYVGGGFVQAGDVEANYIAKWESAAWSALGSGLNGPVEAITISGTNVYVGGWFTSVPGTSANHVAKWDGSQWSPLGSGVDGTVRALAVMGTDIYVGGDFDMAGGNPANHIARWNGVNWTALGSGMSGEFSFTSVRALAATDTEIYAGGAFTNAGGIAANSIAKWNGVAWASLGTGMSNDGPFGSPKVSALVVSGSDLYAGGSFDKAGGNNVNNIAKWDGAGWSALGTGMAFGAEPFASVDAIAVSGSDLYAGGLFTEAGGVPANYIAQWNGTNWSALGSGIDGDGEVRAMTTVGTGLYIGGFFTSVGGVPADNIAMWDGSNWSPLGSGTDGSVSALAALGTDVYAGGNYELAGGKLSPYLALAKTGSVGGPFVVYGGGQATIYLQVNSTGLYQIQRSTNLILNVWDNLGTVTGGENGIISYTDTAPPLPEAYYRAKLL